MPTALEAKFEAAALEAQLQREQRATARGAKQRRLDEQAEERLKTLGGWRWIRTPTLLNNFD